MRIVEENKIPSSNLDECMDHLDSALVPLMTIAGVECSFKPDVINSLLSVQLAIKRWPRNQHLLEILTHWKEQVDMAVIKTYRGRAKDSWRENPVTIDKYIVVREYVFPK